LKKKVDFSTLLAEMFRFENYQVRFNFSHSLEWYTILYYWHRFCRSSKRKAQKYPKNLYPGIDVNCRRHIDVCRRHLSYSCRDLSLYAVVCRSYTVICRSYTMICRYMPWSVVAIQWCVVAIQWSVVAIQWSVVICRDLS
jgi:hypothetical protein